MATNKPTHDHMMLKGAGSIQDELARDSIFEAEGEQSSIQRSQPDFNVDGDSSRKNGLDDFKSATNHWSRSDSKGDEAGATLSPAKRD